MFVPGKLSFRMLAIYMKIRADVMEFIRPTA